MKKLIGITLLLLTLAVGSGAQSLASASYQVSVPVGETKDFVNKTSWLGLGLEFRKFFGEDFTLGLEVDWNYFKEEVPDVITPQGVRTETRSIYSYPLMVTAHYYVGDRQGFMSYIGVGAGMYYIRSKVESLVTAVESNIHLGLAGELGFIYRTRSNLGLLASVKYNYAFETNDVIHRYWSFKFGCIWANY